MLDYRYWEVGDDIPADPFDPQCLSGNDIIYSVLLDGKVVGIINMSQQDDHVSVAAHTDPTVSPLPYVRMVRFLLVSTMEVNDIQWVSTLMEREGPHIKWIKLLGFSLAWRHDETYDRYIYGEYHE